MAKKKLTNIESADSVFDIISGIDESTEILSESQTAVIKDYIDTGNYLLNACMTGSMRKGVPSGRVVTLAGPSGAGKSFLALSICRNAQKKGYTPIYLDSEGAIDRDFVTRLGCDPNNFLIRQVNKISEVSTFIANYCAKLLSMPEEARPKTMIVLDSLGNLSSEKEMTDTLDGTGKRDMTKQQEVKALFRTNATNLAKLNIPMICTSHIYQCVCGDTNILMDDGSVKNIKNVSIGDVVMTKDGGKRVTDTVSYEVCSTYSLTFQSGYSVECTYGHKFMCENGSTFHWVEAQDLTSDDVVLTLNGTDKLSEKIHKKENTVVYDISVDDNHQYVLENGIITHNTMDLFSRQVVSGGSGLIYSASLTIMLNAAKLSDKESDKAAEKKVGEFTKTGVLVTARPEKSRFTIPQKVQFQIPFFKAPNPYVGLEQYLTWENSGIIRGEIIPEAAYNKLLDSEKVYCHEMTDETGATVYARQKDTSRKIVVRHLHKELPLGDLFTKEVITDDIIDYLDENVIRPSFELPSQTSNDDIDEFLETNK